MDGFLYFICFGAAILGAEAAGVGSYSFQDSNGNRYSGTYTIKDGKVIHHKYDDIKGTTEVETLNDVDQLPLPPVPSADVFEGLNNFNFAPEAFSFNPFYPGNNFFDSFFPTIFRNIDLMSQQFASNMDRGFRNMGQNSALAYAGLGNDVGHQIAAINPENPNNPNVDTINRFSEKSPSDRNHKSVSSSSFSSSATGPNGETIQRQMAHTVIDNNGDVREYHVEN